MSDVFRYLWLVLDLIGLVSLCLYGLHMLVAALWPARRPPRPPDSTLRFTFLIPALNEERVIGATVQNLRELAPEARVVVIDDGSEDGTVAVLRRLSGHDRAVRTLRRQLPQARQGKGAALNWAAAQLLADLRAEGADLTREVFVVVDADGRITEPLLREARTVMADDRVVGAQARVRIRASAARLTPQTLLGRLLEQQQDLEFFIIRHLQRLRACWSSVALCGNGQFMRASYLASLNGRAWPDCLSEDVASGLEMRLAAPDHRMAFLESAVTQQGLPDLRRFVRQRARWTQGTLQCAGYLPRLWSAPLPWQARLDLSYFLLNPWISGTVLLSFVTHPLRYLIGGPGLVLSPLDGALISVLSMGLQLHWTLRYGLERRLRLGGLLWTLLGLPAYAVALILSVPLAFWHHASGRRAWDKTSRHAETGELPTVPEGLS